MDKKTKKNNQAKKSISATLKKTSSTWCSTGTMSHNRYLLLIDLMDYYLRLAQPRNQINNAIQGDHCVLETAVRNSLCYDTMIQNIILAQISSAQKSNS